MTQQELQIGDVVETVEELHTYAGGVFIAVPAGTRFVVNLLTKNGGVGGVTEKGVTPERKVTLMPGMYRPVRTPIRE